MKEVPTSVTGQSAIEVARDLPTAVTLASNDETLGKILMELMKTPHFRIYRSRDLIGVQIGGAIKNVLAIACGIVEGRGLGENSRAALVTRGLAEIKLRSYQFCIEGIPCMVVYRNNYSCASNHLHVT